MAKEEKNTIIFLWQLMAFFIRVCRPICGYTLAFLLSFFDEQVYIVPYTQFFFVSLIDFHNQLLDST